MKAFSYSLAPVLQSREAAELGRQMRMAAVVSELKEARTLLQRLKEDLRRGVSLHEGLAGRQVSGHELQVHLRCRDRAEHREERQAREVARLEGLLEQARSELEKAMLDRKTLEKARHREHSEWRKRVHREEQILTDEIAGIGAARRGIL